MATDQNDSTNGYLISEAMINRIFGGSAILMVLALLALLLVATARPQGRLSHVDTSQARSVHATALERLSGSAPNAEGNDTLDIRTAMELVVERGF